MKINSSNLGTIVNIMKHSHMRLYFAVCVMILVGEGFLIFSHFNSGNNVSFASTSSKAGFTELYFENHTSLPTFLSPDNKVAFSFTIHNAENKDMLYSYEIYSDNGTTKKVLNSKNISIQANKFVTISESIELQQESAKRAIVVNLLNKNQHIDFYIEGANK